MSVRCLFFGMFSFLLLSDLVNAETIQIEFTENDTYSVEVAHINVGDKISVFS